MMRTNGTAWELCMNNLTYDESLYISNLIWHVFGLTGVLVGIPGHVLQIIILSKNTNRKEPTSLYFIAIAIFEIVFLLGLFWLWCASMSFVKTDPREVIPCGIFYSILVGSTALSHLYLASLSIDRSIIILYPTRYRVLVTRLHVLLRILTITLIVIFLLIPHHFYLYYDRRATLFLCDFYPSLDHRQIRLWSFIHAILFVSIPSLIVCVCSAILLHNRCKHKRMYKNNLSISARRLHRHSLLIFFVSVGLFLSLIPGCILKIFFVYDRLSDRDIVCSPRWKTYKILLSCFLTLSSINYSFKFYIHLIISTTFRKNVIQFITCRSDQQASRLTRANDGNNNQQRLLPVNDPTKARTIEI